MSVATPTRTEFDEKVEELREEREDDYTGWFAIRTRPFPCPASGCTFVALFQTAAHLIVVWPGQDDRALLSCARDCREAGRDPRIVEYDYGMGPCIAWDEWRRIGGPVHGRLPVPDGWEERTPPL